MFSPSEPNIMPQQAISEQCAAKMKTTKKKSKGKFYNNFQSRGKLISEVPQGLVQKPVPFKIFMNVIWEAGYNGEVTSAD